MKHFVRSASRTSLMGEERGTVILVVTIVLIVLLGFAGLAIDFGYAYVQKARMQAQVDAAAIACGQKGTCLNGQSTLPDNSAVISPIDVYGAPMDVEVGVLCPGISGATNCVRVTSTQTWNTFFIKLFNVPTLTMSVEAVAAAAASTRTAAILGLSESGAPVSFVGVGPVQTNGDVISNGSVANSSGALAINGDVIATGSVTGITAANVTGSILTGQSVTTDPCEGVPVPVISGPPQVVPSLCPGKSNATTIPAGVYNTLNVDVSNNKCAVSFTGNYVVQNGMEITMSAGSLLTMTDAVFYIENGGVSITLDASNAEVRATDSLFYIEEGGISIVANKSGVVDLQPVFTGMYSGLLFWYAGNTLNLDFSLNQPKAIVNLGGLVYAPNSTVNLSKPTQSNEITTITGLIGQSVVIENAGNINTAAFLFNTPQNGLCGGVNSGAAGRTSLLK